MRSAFPMLRALRCRSTTPQGDKCARCWMILPEVGKNATPTRPLQPLRGGGGMEGCGMMPARDWGWRSARGALVVDQGSKLCCFTLRLRAHGAG